MHIYISKIGDREVVSPDDGQNRGLALIEGASLNYMTNSWKISSKWFSNYMRMPPEMFDGILEIVSEFKLALTLRHLASGSKYNNMRLADDIPSS